MLLANAPPETLLQVAALLVTTLVGAWLTVRLRQVDQQAKRHRRLSRAEKERCDGLEVRVVQLEEALAACLERRKRPRPNPRRKR